MFKKGDYVRCKQKAGAAYCVGELCGNGKVLIEMDLSEIEPWTPYSGDWVTWNGAGRGYVYRGPCQGSPEISRVQCPASGIVKHTATISLLPVIGIEGAANVPTRQYDINWTENMLRLIKDGGAWCPPAMGIFRVDKTKKELVFCAKSPAFDQDMYDMTKVCCSRCGYTIREELE